MSFTLTREAQKIFLDASYKEMRMRRTNFEHRAGRRGQHARPKGLGLDLVHKFGYDVCTSWVHVHENGDLTAYSEPNDSPIIGVYYPADDFFLPFDR